MAFGGKLIARAVGFGPLMNEQQRRYDNQRQNAMLCSPYGTASPFHGDYAALHGGIQVPLRHGPFGPIHAPHRPPRRYPHMDSWREPHMLLGPRPRHPRRPHPRGRLPWAPGRHAIPFRQHSLRRPRPGQHLITGPFDLDDDLDDDDSEDDLFSDSDSSDLSYDSLDDMDSIQSSFIRLDPRQERHRMSQGRLGGFGFGRGGFGGRRRGNMLDPRTGPFFGGGRNRVPGDYPGHRHRPGRYQGGRFDDMSSMYSSEFGF